MANEVNVAPDSNVSMTPDQVQELKVSISNEIARRSLGNTNNPSHGPGNPGNLSRARSNNAAGVTLKKPTMNKPDKGDAIRAEVGTEILGKLSQLNSFGDIEQNATMISGELIPKEFDYNYLKNYLENLAVDPSVEQSSTGCKSSCTGLCAGNCYSKCTGYFTFNSNFFSDFFSSFFSSFSGDGVSLGMSGEPDQSGSSNFTYNSTVTGFHNQFTSSNAATPFSNQAFSTSGFTTSFGGNGGMFNADVFSSSSSGTVGGTSSSNGGAVVTHDPVLSFSGNNFANSADNSNFTGDFAGNFGGNFSGNFGSNFSNVNRFSSSFTGSFYDFSSYGFGNSTFNNAFSGSFYPASVGTVFSSRAV